MDVYALLGVDDDLGTLLLGIYHTKENAEFHRDLYVEKSMKEDGFTIDAFGIERYVIGARANPR